MSEAAPRPAPAGGRTGALFANPDLDLAVQRVPLHPGLPITLDIGTSCSVVVRWIARCGHGCSPSPCTCPGTPRGVTDSSTPSPRSAHRPHPDGDQGLTSRQRGIRSDPVPERTWRWDPHLDVGRPSRRRRTCRSGCVHRANVGCSRGRVDCQRSGDRDRGYRLGDALILEVPHGRVDNAGIRDATVRLDHQVQHLADGLRRRRLSGCPLAPGDPRRRVRVELDRLGVEASI